MVHFKSVIASFLLLTCLPVLVKGQSTSVEQKTGGATTRAEFRIPGGVNPADGLSEDEAVAVALWNNPQLHADLAALGLARADLKDAGLLRNPLLTLLLPVSPFPQLESAIQFPVDVFWQRRKRVEAAKAELERVAVSLDQNALTLIRDVRLVFTDLELARRRVEMSAETLRIRKETLRLMRIRLREGDVSEAEVAAAALDESLAEEQAARFERETVIVRNRLRHVLGMIEQPETTFERPALEPALPTGGEPSLENLTAAAVASRPDVRAAEFSIAAATKRAKWERSRIGALSALLNFKNGAGVGFAPRPGLVAELPVFNRNQGGIGRADAEVQRAAWQFLVTRQRIALDVAEAFNQRKQALETLKIWQQQTIPAATENLRLAERAFQTGDQSFLVVLEADRRLVDIRMREAELKADARRAEIQLERAVGRTYDAKP